MTQRYVIAVGNPFDGITLYGDPDKNGEPWDDSDAAGEYAHDTFKNDTWWLPEIENPDGPYNHPSLDEAARALSETGEYVYHGYTIRPDRDHYIVISSTGLADSAPDVLSALRTINEHEENAEGILSRDEEEKA